MPDSFDSEIEQFADEYVNNYPAPIIDDSGKVIHDALWGTQYLNPHELAFLDTPLLQRLRRIKQTAFAYLIFPSATHSRFEHTLGVIFHSNRLLKTLSENLRYEKLIRGKEDLIRMAGLLHDCGHGPFSHSSEEIYKFLSDMEVLIGPDGKHEGCNPHEVLTYYIIKSSPFKKRFNDVIAKYQRDIDIDQVADLILAEWKNPSTKFLQDMINGPFDADKLDYLFRDGHFSGLPLKIDLDRLWYSVQILNVPRPEVEARMLVMSINGTTPLEQILFSKMVLFTSLYQHHKVRTCDCMLKAIYQYAVNNDQKIGGRTLKKATDFLWLTDDMVYAEADRREKEDPLHKLIHALKFRRLLKRALIISKTTVEEPSKDAFGYTILKKFCADSKNKESDLRRLAENIWDEAGKPCSLYDVWVDMPKLPPTGAADETYVNKGTLKSPDFVRLKDIFRVDDWAQDYTEHNWRGHVFCPDDPIIRRKISGAAKSVIEKEFSIKFNKSSTALCKFEN